MDRKDADSVNYALSSVLKEFNEYASAVFKSITADNGSEFAGLSEMFGDRIDIYFTHPYSSWESGTNTNHNGIICRFIPKEHTIEEAMNNLPRKIFAYKTSNELFEEELKKLVA